MIYLDYTATAPVSDAVLTAYQDYLTNVYANPASRHRAGLSAADHLKEDSRRIASLLGAEADQLIMTSGGTESINAALKFLLLAPETYAQTDHYNTRGTRSDTRYVPVSNDLAGRLS